MDRDELMDEREFAKYRRNEERRSAPMVFTKNAGFSHVPEPYVSAAMRRHLNPHSSSSNNQSRARNDIDHLSHSQLASSSSSSPSILSSSQDEEEYRSTMDPEQEYPNSQHMSDSYEDQYPTAVSRGSSATELSSAAAVLIPSSLPASPVALISSSVPAVRPLLFTASPVPSAVVSSQVIPSAVPPSSLPAVPQAPRSSPSVARSQVVRSSSAVIQSPSAAAVPQSSPFDFPGTPSPSSSPAVRRTVSSSLTAVPRSDDEPFAFSFSTPRSDSSLTAQPEAVKRCPRSDYVVTINNFFQLRIHPSVKALFEKQGGKQTPALKANAEASARVEDTIKMWFNFEQIASDATNKVEIGETRRGATRRYDEDKPNTY